MLLDAPQNSEETVCSFLSILMGAELKAKGLESGKTSMLQMMTMNFGNAAR